MTMKITHLRHIALNSLEPQAHAEFYAQKWGLHLVAEQDGGYYLRGAKTEAFILALLPAERRGIARLSFALSSRDAVLAAATELAGKNVSIYQPPAPLETPGGGFGFQIIDPEGRRLEFSAGVEPAPEAEWQAVVRPNKISHAVLNTANFDTIIPFYTEVLGLRISDWSEQQMVFLRCSTDHHCVAFNRAAHASLNHVAYELPSIDSFMRGIGSLHRKGVDPMWGPGRHGPGDNTFCYFRDGFGYVCEYTSEVLQIDDTTHVAQVWERVPEKMDQWGMSGPPSPQAREAMAGEPDPGFSDFLAAPRAG